MVSIERAMHYKDMWKEPKSSDIQRVLVKNDV